MINHVIMFRWRAEATSAQRAEAHRGLTELRIHIPQLLSLTLGEDTREYQSDYDLVALASFATRADFRSFRADPFHKRLISERLEPILDAVARVQYETREDGSTELLDDRAEPLRPVATG